MPPPLPPLPAPPVTASFFGPGMCHVFLPWYRHLLSRLPPTIQVPANPPDLAAPGCSWREPPCQLGSALEIRLPGGEGPSRCHPQESSHQSPGPQLPTGPPCLSGAAGTFYSGGLWKGHTWYRVSGGEPPELALAAPTSSSASALSCRSGLGRPVSSPDAAITSCHVWATLARPDF